MKLGQFLKNMEKTNNRQPNDHQVYENLLKQCFELWINPEIERRKTEDILGQDFRLKVAQIIFCLGHKPIIRLNKEAKVLVSAKLKRTVKKGELIYDSDVEHIKGLQLTDEEKDFGHITTVLFRGSWIIGFSFIYDASKSKELLEIGQTYLSSAQKDFHDKNYRPMIESLSIAAENFAKARLYLLPDDLIRKTQKHGLVRAKVNVYAKTSNIITTGFKDTFNKLQDIRDKARYNSQFKLTPNEAEKMIGDVEGLENDVLHWIVYATNNYK